MFFFNRFNRDPIGVQDLDLIKKFKIEEDAGGERKRLPTRDSVGTSTEGKVSAFFCYLECKECTYCLNYTVFIAIK